MMSKWHARWPFTAGGPEPAGLCDAIFRALPLIAPDELAVVGLPDTIWFPADAMRSLGDDPCSFLLFPAEQPQLFDSVRTNAKGGILGIYTKSPDPDAGEAYAPEHPTLT